MKTLKNHLGLVLLVTAVVLVTAIVFSSGYDKAHGSVTGFTPPGDAGVTTFRLFASTTPTGGESYATTTSATSTAINLRFNAAGIADNGTIKVGAAKKVTWFFGRGDTSGQGNTGTSTFRVQVQAPDGTWMYWGKWQENASTTIGFTSDSVSSNGPFNLVGTTTVAISMDLTLDSFTSARCVVVETIDGEHSCAANVVW